MSNVNSYIIRFHLPIKIYKFLLPALFCLGQFPSHTFGQTPINIEVNSGNILGTPSYDIVSFNATNCLATIAADISVLATGDFTSTTSNPAIEIPPVSTIHLKIKSVGTLISLQNVKDIDLSKTSQSMFSALLSLVSSGAVIITYSIINKPQTYYAGIYNTGLQFKLTGLLCSSPTINDPLTLIVLPFNLPTQPAPTTFTINSFDQYRSQGITTSQSFTNLRTVPMTLQLKADDPFNFSGANGITPPTTSISAVKTRLNTPALGTYQSLSSTFQNLSGAENLTVPIGNQETIKIDYNLSPTDLQTGFMQAGTYISTIKGQLIDARTSPSNPAPSASISSDLTVIIPDLKELNVNQSDINLNFSNVSDYQNGVSVDMPNHLTVSNTNPFDIYVNASSNTLLQSNGTNTIPIDCIQIGPATGQSDVQTVTLSTTPQKIISGGQPCLDKNYSIRYSIPANKTSEIFSKPTDSYSVTVTYSFTAP